MNSVCLITQKLDVPKILADHSGMANGSGKVDERVSIICGLKDSQEVYYTIELYIYIYISELLYNLVLHVES